MSENRTTLLLYYNKKLFCIRVILFYNKDNSLARPKYCRKHHASAKDDLHDFDWSTWCENAQTSNNTISLDRAPYLIIARVRRQIYAGVLMLRIRVSNKPKGARYNIIRYCFHINYNVLLFYILSVLYMNIIIMPFIVVSTYSQQIFVFISNYVPIIPHSSYFIRLC